MNHTNYILKSNKNKYFKEEDRYKLEALLKIKLKTKDIVKTLNKSRSTIYREIKRGTIELQNSDLTYRSEYCADVAQRKYLENSKNKGPAIKLGNDYELAAYIENEILKNKKSPDAIIGEIKRKKINFKVSICTKTLYNYIDKNVFLNITNKNLWIKRNGKKQKYRKTSKITKKNILNRSIERRPEYINDRSKIGHWEMDCVVSGRGGKTALLVLTERKTRQIIIRKIGSKNQECVGKELDLLETEYKYKFKKTFKSITMDNGSEFINQAVIEKSILTKKRRTTAYYAHPYSSWERGSNENSNKIIRRFIKKGSNIGNYSKEKIKSVELWINNLPRKTLDYLSSNEYYKDLLQV
jgi:IS30 family transposase